MNSQAQTTQERARSLMTAQKRALKNRQQAMLKRSADEIGLAADNY
ncbi:MAG: hypothetical protein ICV63_02985 [Coleofasciculus sp. Co-bin14]|jgi:hypothetical protein|nr:hypothetical protein [Coleofasciculus sp. Co-bin14]